MTDEIDFEVDPEDLPDRAVEGVRGTPSVVVDDLHVTYKVVGGKPARTRTRSLLSRLRPGGGGPVGAVSEVQAVRGVSFVAYHGESIGIVGTNGSGKSTLLRAVAGLIPPTQGRVFHSGQAALLGVNAALMRGLSGERNIMIGGLALGLTAKEIRERIPEVVDFAGLGDFVYLPMSAYSSGMAARLRFAISTMARPDVLMIDEALSTGDAAFRQKSKQRIDEIREHAGTVFFVSHSLASVRAMCTRIIWLDKGRICMDGPVDQVAEAYRAHLRSAAGSGAAGAVLGQSKAPASKGGKQGTSVRPTAKQGTPAKHAPAAAGPASWDAAQGGAPRP